MRAAEEILKEKFPNAPDLDWFKPMQSAINQARKEALEEAAERATITGREWPYYRGIVDKQSILSLIHELK